VDVDDVAARPVDGARRDLLEKITQPSYQGGRWCDNVSHLGITISRSRHRAEYSFDSQ
jgi:hypothetical protein